MQLKKYKVYLLQTPRSAKVYVGYTGQKYVSSRLGKHRQEAKRGTDTHLYRAMRLYGPNSFSWQLLGDFDTKEQATTLEKIWIILLRAQDSEFGYNTTGGGEAPKHSEETKQKISQIQKDNPLPAEFYKHLGELSKDPKRRAAHSEAIKAAWASGAYDSRKGDNSWSHRVGLSEESRKKLSESLRKAHQERPWWTRAGKKATEETKAKMSASMKGLKRGPMSDEHKAKVGASIRATNAKKKEVKLNADI